MEDRIQVKIRSWYPAFVVRWLVGRAIKKNEKGGRVMKANKAITLFIFFIACLLAILYVSQLVYRAVNYLQIHEDMVRQTIEEIVKPEYLKLINK